MGRKAKIRQERRLFQLIQQALENKSDIGSEIIKADTSEMPVAYKDMLDNLRKTGLDEAEIVIEPPGQDKMSKILLEFVQPFVEALDPKYETIWEKIINLGVIAWNCTLLEPVQSQEMIEDTLNRIFPLNYDTKGREKMANLLNLMIDFKKEYYSEYNRFIYDYQIQDKGDTLNLSVISAIDWIVEAVPSGGAGGVRASKTAILPDRPQSKLD